jgi:hypothetical protein
LEATVTTPDDEPPGLFTVDPEWRAAPRPDAGLSAGRRLTLRQAADLAAGRHPLTRGALHPDAAPAADRTAAGHRCGGCRFRAPTGATRAYPKCLFGWSGNAWDDPPRRTSGAATDVRGWWPACQDFQPQINPPHHVDDLTGCE